MGSLAQSPNKTLNMVANGVTATGLAWGPNKGHVVEPLPKRVRQSQKKGKLGVKVKLARDVIREVRVTRHMSVVPWSCSPRASTSVHLSSARRGSEPTVAARRSVLISRVCSRHRSSRSKHSASCFYESSLSKYSIRLKKKKKKKKKKYSALVPLL